MKKISIFVISTFIVTWIIWGLLALNFSNFNNITAQLIVACTMFVPGIMAVLTKLIFKDTQFNIKPNIKGNGKYYLAAWFLPAIITVIGCIVYFVIFKNFNANASYYKVLLQPAIDAGQILSSDVKSLLMIEIITAITIAPILNIIPAFGEELGWRGLLLPALCEKVSERKAILISGLIWGVWHIPITIMGHNYGIGYFGYPILGIFAMCIFCITFGSFLSYITLKTQSVWPASLAHGAINAIAGIGVYFVSDISAINLVLGPTTAGLIGGIGSIILGFICFNRTNNV